VLGDQVEPGRLPLPVVRRSRLHRLRHLRGSTYERAERVTQGDVIRLRPKRGQGLVIPSRESVQRGVLQLDYLIETQVRQ
jgi:hypothetical protein